MTIKACPDCDGKGRRERDRPCSTCEGEGAISVWDKETQELAEKKLSGLSLESASGMLNEKQSKKFVELAVGNAVLTSVCTVTCLQCGGRGVGRWHKLVCWWRRLRR